MSESSEVPAVPEVSCPQPEVESPAVSETTEDKIEAPLERIYTAHTTSDDDSEDIEVKPVVALDKLLCVHPKFEDDYFKNLNSLQMDCGDTYFQILDAYFGIYAELADKNNNEEEVSEKSSLIRSDPEIKMAKKMADKIVEHGTESLRAMRDVIQMWENRPNRSRRDNKQFRKFLSFLSHKINQFQDWLCVQTSLYTEQTGQSSQVDKTETITHVILRAQHLWGMGSN